MVPLKSASNVPCPPMSLTVSNITFAPTVRPPRIGTRSIRFNNSHESGIFLIFSKSLTLDEESRTPVKPSVKKFLMTLFLLIFILLQNVEARHEERRKPLGVAYADWFFVCSSNIQNRSICRISILTVRNTAEKHLFCETSILDRTFWKWDS